MRQDLKEAFGNPDWTAVDEFRQLMLEVATKSDYTLELGSGLTSLDLADAGVKGSALEHLAGWVGFVRGVASATKVDLDADFIVQYSPFKDYGKFEWYSVGPSGPIDFVVCDGPPRGSTKGGRYGFLPVMADVLTPGCLILFDDYIVRGTGDISPIVVRWQEEYDVTTEEVWTPKDEESNPFALLRAP